MSLTKGTLSQRASQLIQLGGAQLKEEGHIPNLKDYISEAIDVTQDESLNSFIPPENFEDFDKNSKTAFEMRAIRAVQSSIYQWGASGRNIGKTISNAKEVEKENEKRREEREKWEAEQKEREAERNKKKQEEVKKKTKEEKEPTDEEIKKQAEEEIQDHYKTLKIKKDATKEEIDKAYQEAIQNQSEKPEEEVAEIQKAYHTLSDTDFRRTYDKQLGFQINQASKKIKDEIEKSKESGKTTEKLQPEIDSSWQYIIAFTPNLTEESDDWSDMKDQHEQAKINTQDFRDNSEQTGLIKLDSKEIDELKKIGAIPQDATDSEAISIITTSNRIYANGGKSNDLFDALDKNKSITEIQRKRFFDPVVANVRALEVSNPTLSSNLHLANGRPNINVFNPPEISTSLEGIKNVAIEFSNKVLAPVFEKVKAGASDAAKAFLTKSLKSKAAKSVFNLVKKVGLKVVMEAAMAAVNAIPGLGQIAYAAIKIVAAIVGKLIEKALVRIKKFVEDHKDLFAAFGIGGLVLGLLGVGAISTAIGVLSIGTLLVFGGLPFVTSGAAVVATTTIAFIVAAAPVASIALWIIFSIIALVFLTIITLFIINSGGYVLPALFEQGPGGFTPPDCLGEPPPIPDAGEVRFSADGRYAYPVGEFPNPPYSAKGCYHWDGNKAADLFSPLERPPLVAYESGTIAEVVMNDSLGGKYIKLKGSGTNPRYYYYAHLCHVFVRTGESVSAGQVIGTMDETGSGRVQHLHFAINAPPLGISFMGGDGNVCPYTDFEQKFRINICVPTSLNCITP